jgi:hypothetical protein
MSCTRLRRGSGNTEALSWRPRSASSLAIFATMPLRGVPRQQCAENQIGDNGFQQGAGRLLVASRHADVVGDHNAASH